GKGVDGPSPLRRLSAMSTWGRPAGCFTWNRGGGVALRASTSVIGGLVGSGMGSTVRSVGPTTGGGLGACAATGSAVSETARAGISSEIVHWCFTGAASSRRSIGAVDNPSVAGQGVAEGLTRADLIAHREATPHL